MDRRHISTEEWFSGSLAIADVVWVEGIGLCSHQPDLNRRLPPGWHRMRDVEGNVHFVETEKLFYADREERNRYWCEIDWGHNG